MSTEKKASESDIEPLSGDTATPELAAEADSATTATADASDEGVDREAEAGTAEPSPEVTESPRKQKPQSGPQEKPEVQALRKAQEEHSQVEGKVIGWNRGGFHVVVGDITAFCPRSEMELGPSKPPEQYLDKTLEFQVLKVQKRGRRIVLSRTASMKAERAKAREELRNKIQPGAVLSGYVATLTDFGAFVDLGGRIQGLVHISEISHQRIEKPEDVLQVGQEVSVKVLKIEKGGKRISLSMRALEDSPWNHVKERFPPGMTLKGKVQRTTRHGALIELEPGLTGLLPASTMSLPPEASMARAYPAGREVSVQVMQVDERRHRISLALEGSAVEGTWHDFQDYRKQQHEDGGGFNALANALKKAHIDAD